MCICDKIQQWTQNWGMHGWGLTGTVVTGTIAITTLPATLSGAIGGSILTSTGTVIGVGLGFSRELDKSRKVVQELKDELAIAGSNVKNAAAETLKHWDGLLQYGGWTVLSGGVSALLKWHENQYCAAENSHLACAPAQLATAALLMSTVGCTYFLLGKIKMYHQKQKHEDNLFTAKQKLEIDLKQAQENLIKLQEQKSSCNVM